MIVDTEIIVCTLGTRGDILPFLALAKPFCERGYRVMVLTNRNWEGLVRSIGAEFHEIASEDPPQDGRNDYDFFLENTLPSFSRSFSFIAARVRDGAKCALVYRLNMLGAECAAEKFRLPSIKVALQPYVIRSAESPPWPMTRLVHGRFSGISKKFIIPLLYALGGITASYRRHSNAFRRSVGLEALSTFGKAKGKEDALLIMCPDWFALPQKDWPATSRLLGFSFFDTSFSDRELEDFIERFDKPIVFTPGTGVQDPASFFEVAKAVCDLTGLPVVFLSRGLPHPAHLSHEKLMTREFVALEWILPRARMLVHHGGIGSTAQAIRAGIPQIVIPRRFDQPDNALRVAMLGLGAAVFSKKPGLEELGDLVRKVLASPELKAQLKIAADLVNDSDAVEIAYSLIESIVRRYLPDDPPPNPARKASLASPPSAYTFSPH